MAYGEYLGTYTANFGPFLNEPFEVVWRDGNLALDIPSQLIFALDRAGQEERWTLRDDPAVAVSFVRDEAGEVTDLLIDQGGATIDIPRGAPEPEAEVELQPGEVDKYLGWFHDAETGREVEVLFQAGQLALRVPETTEPLGLFPPDVDGGWRVRINPTVVILFAEEEGTVVSYTARGPGGEATFTRMDPPPPGSEG